MSGELLYGRFAFRAWDENIQDYWDWEEIQEDWESEGYYDSIFRQDHWVCEQCTGFRDKNGKFIYEGDLIKSPNNSNILEVIWEKGVWQTKEYRKNGKHELFLYILATNYGVEVIGNIHENSELLKEGK